MTPTRRAMLVAGIATVAVSLVLSIAPTLAKNPNAGTVKIYDAETGTETTANDPHVCSFWFSFSDPDAAETGSWQLLDWPPTGDGSLVTEGTYSTAGDGEDDTATLSPAAGHYRFEWTATSANTKNKTLWVDDTCGTDAESGTATPTPTPTPTPSESASESEDPTPTPSESVSESEDPTPTPSESVSESEDPTPSEDVEAETGTPTPSESEAAAATPTPTPSESEAEAPASEQPSADPAHATGTPTPTQPGQQVESGRSTDTPSSLPDTSTGGQLTGLLAAIGVLLIVAAHAGTRRSKLPERV